MFYTLSTQLQQCDDDQITSASEPTVTCPVSGIPGAPEQFLTILLPALRSPDTEKIHSTYASEAGAEMTSSASGANSGHDGSRLDYHCNGVSVLYAMSTVSTLYFASSVAMSPLRQLMVAVDDNSEASAAATCYKSSGEQVDLMLMLDGCSWPFRVVVTFFAMFAASFAVEYGKCLRV